jgi:uncharacterized membrane protein YeaQ/YmgE (transglycosylase-associated protein family)
MWHSPCCFFPIEIDFGAANRAKRENNMSIIGWILFGFVVGILGKLLLPGGKPGGFLLTILLGITGALLGGIFRSWLGLSGEPAGSLLAIVGSLMLLPLFGAIAARRG